jgi:hypothetical protein
MVGSSIMSTVLVGSICIESHAHEATSDTNMRGGRITYEERGREGGGT